MNLRNSLLPLCVASVVGTFSPLHAASIFSAGDVGFAIDLDTDSFSPDVEDAQKAIDSDPNTIYVNFGKQNSGLILSNIQGPGSGAVSTLAVTTGTSFPARDPSSYIVLGSNDPVINTTNPSAVSNGWTYLTSGALNLSTARQDTSEVSLGGTYSYSSYWVIFPTLRDSPSAASVFQVGEVKLGSTSGSPVFLGMATATSWQGSNPATNASAAFDGNANTSYFNSGGANSGFVVTPQVGATVVQSFTLTTSADHPENDPASYTLYGQTSAGVWQMIQNGSFLADQVPLDRTTNGASIGVNNTTAYKSYGFVVNSMRDGSTSTGVQFADIHFDTVVPEPSSTWLTATTAALGLLGARRRR